VPFAAEQRPAVLGRAQAAGEVRLLRLLGLLLEQRRLITEADDASLAVAVALGRAAVWPRVRRVEELLAGLGLPERGANVAADSPQLASPASAPGAPPAAARADFRRRLATALDDTGAHLLAAAVMSATEARVEGEALTLVFPPSALANGITAQESLAQLVAAAKAAGIAEEVRVEPAGVPPQAPVRQDVRAQVEAHEGVQRVLAIFGGRVERIEEKA